MTFLYKHAILGGTFDHLHLGHEKFIAHALSLSATLTIGIVKEPWVKSKIYPECIESYQIRLSSLQTFITRSRTSQRVTIIPISDIYGTALSDPSIDAIFVTESTRDNADLINSKRSELQLPPLPIVVVPFEVSRDGGTISSSRIRSGEIDRSGFVYKSILEGKRSLILPESLRTSLKDPIGTVLTDLSHLNTILDSKSLIFTVGDIVSRDLLDSGYTPAVVIVDFYTRRAPIDSDTIAKYFASPQFHLSNPAGTINLEFSGIFDRAIALHDQSGIFQIIQVDGEEDLLTLPTILLAPLGSFVVYGQYKVGMCIVEVSEEMKKIAKNYLALFYNNSATV